MHPSARRRSVLAALLAGALLTGCTNGDEPASTPAAAVAGSDTIGDPYFPTDGNGGYEVDSYGLDLGYDPATDVLTGVATIAARADQRLSSFHLDLVGLVVASITVDGVTATWTRDGDELVVTPAQPVEEGGFSTVVSYDGVPEPVRADGGTAGFLPTDDGAVVAGEPHVAATWFPANDHPSDPATVELTIAVPAGLVAVSNGELLDATTADGTTTWHWRATDPMSTYLVTLAIGDYRLTDREVDGVRYWDAVDSALFDAGGTPSTGDTATASLQRQPEILDFLADRFGPYPFDVAGGIVIADEGLGFALESQTRPIYAPDFFGDAGAGALVVVHELAHQWFGDSVHLAAWQHVWLNEGFATYAEWLWTEQQGGETVQEQFDDLAATPADDDLWALAPGDPGSAGDELFSQAVYLRGAMTLVAVRQQIGEDDFAQLLLRWAADEAGQAVTTDDFVALAEEVSGQQLDDLFRTWLFTAGRPPGLG